MMIHRLLRRLRHCVVIPIAALLAGAHAFAQEKYPAKPVQILVPFSPGTATDLLARMHAAKLAERLGQSFVVQNRTGAGGMVATQAVAAASADGYTLLMANSAHAINPSLYAKLAFDSLRDFAGVALVGESAYLVVANPQLGAKRLADLVALAKQKPGTIHYASAGVGSATHLAGAYFTSLAAIDLVHVPYKNTADYIADLVSGRVQVTFAPTAFLLQNIREGKLLALGVSTAEPMRTPLEVPSARDAGINYDFNAWFGLLAPARTPAAIIELLARTLREVVEGGALAEDYRKIGLAPRIVTLAEFDAYIRRDTEKQGALVRASGAKSE